MALKLNTNKKVHIIDKTVLELANLGIDLGRLELTSLCWMLKDLGVDLIEINTSILAKFRKVPGGIDFIFRIDNQEDINLGKKYGLKNFILNGTHNCKELLEKINLNETKVIIELDLNRVLKDGGLNEVRVLQTIGPIDGIRISGLSKQTTDLWSNVIDKLRRILKTRIDVCPENRYFNANAAALEAIMNGADFVTLSFMGIGKGGGFAALEEVILAAKVLGDISIDGNLNTLSELSIFFQRITGLDISDSKPVLGKDIFRFEAGIHADGISKDPQTYEPFDPNLVGKNRELKIGKHSGSKAIIKKLNEMGIECSIKVAVEMVGRVRERSILHKRALLDAEIKEVYEETYPISV